MVTASLCVVSLSLLILNITITLSLRSSPKWSRCSAQSQLCGLVLLSRYQQPKRISRLLGSTSGLATSGTKKKSSKKTKGKTAVKDDDNSDDDDNKEDKEVKSKRKSLGSKGHMTLVIVESPAKARTIQKFVDSDKYIIDFCAGHVRDLPAAGKTTAAYLSQLASKEAAENNKVKSKSKSKSKSGTEGESYFNEIKSLKKVIIEDNLKLNIADLGVNVLKNFEPLYMPVEGKEEIISRLKRNSQKCDRILLATDEDREGEAISWHLLEVLQPQVPYKRAVFHEITKGAILSSFDNPRDIDMKLVQSQETRRIVDRLTGYTISPVLWRYVAPGLSAGRVQSCGLFLITQREQERWKFVPSQYFSIRANLQTSERGKESQRSNANFICKMHSIDNKRIANEKDFDGNTGKLYTSKDKDKILLLEHDMANKVMNWLIGRDAIKDKKKAGTASIFRIKSIDSKKLTRNPPKAFITSTLQQDASRKLGLSPSRTMSIAQKLYEEGFITYMRTDSPLLSSVALNTAQSFVKKTFGDEYLGLTQAVSTTTVKDIESKGDKKKNESRQNAAPLNAQEAHEAIRPSESNGSFKSPSETGLGDIELTLYTLIYKRTIASVMSASKSLTKTLSIEATNDKDTDFKSVNFRTSKTVVSFKGFSAAFELTSDGKVYNGRDHDNQSDEVSMDTLVVDQELYVAAKIDKSDDSDQIDSKDDDFESSKKEIVEDADSNEKDVTVDDSDYVKSSIVIEGIEGTQHSTRPPSRFSEASFIKELELIGVGRPSTYSKIFQILKDRGYIIVDKQTLLPTVTGMVVSAFLERHFPDLVETQFTARMEDSLDGIANGSKNKTEFLHDFYLKEAVVSTADEDNSNNDVGLLRKVSQKLASNKIDHKESRILVVPFLQSLGTLQFSRSGAFIETNSSINSTSPSSSPLSSSSSSSNGRWRLPDIMNADIRLITADAIINLMKTEASIEGSVLGVVDVSNINKTVAIKSGRFGKYLQVGSTDDADKSTHSIPQWVDSAFPLEEVYLYSKLPIVLGNFPIPATINADRDETPLNLVVAVDVKSKQLCVTIKDYPIQAPLPEGTLISDINLQMAIQHLPEYEEILQSQKVLGDYNGSTIILRQGRYGFYIRCGDKLAGLKKIDHTTLTLEAAIEHLEKYGKTKATKGPKAKTAKTKKAAKASAGGSKKLSGYQVFVKEKVAIDKIKMTQAATMWKTLDDSEKTRYKNIASQETTPLLETAPHQIISKPNKRTTKASKKTNEKKSASE